MTTLSLGVLSWASYGLCSCQASLDPLGLTQSQAVLQVNIQDVNVLPDTTLQLELVPQGEPSRFSEAINLNETPDSLLRFTFTDVPVGLVQLRCLIGVEGNLRPALNAFQTFTLEPGINQLQLGCRIPLALPLPEPTPETDETLTEDPGADDVAPSLEVTPTPPLPIEGFATVNIRLRAFVPSPAEAQFIVGDNLAANLTCLGEPTLCLFGGDSRSFTPQFGTHRVLLDTVISLDPTSETIVESPTRQICPTFIYRPSDGRRVLTRSRWWRSLAPDAVPLDSDTATLSSDNIRIDQLPYLLPVPTNARLLQITLSVPNPFFQIEGIPSPDISAVFLVLLSQSNVVEPPAYFLTGLHDSFPSYELYLNGQPVYRFDAEQGLGPEALFGIPGVVVTGGPNLGLDGFLPFTDPEIPLPTCGSLTN